MPLHNLVRKPQLLPWKNTASKDSPQSTSCPLREAPRGPGLGALGKVSIPSCLSHVQVSGETKVVSDEYTHTHIRAHCYLSQRWDFNPETLVTALLEMPQHPLLEMPLHPLLGTAGTCHSKATCTCTACPRASVCSVCQGTQGRELGHQDTTAQDAFPQGWRRAKETISLLKQLRTFHSLFTIFSPIVRKRHRFCLMRREDTEKTTSV